MLSTIKLNKRAADDKQISNNKPMTELEHKIKEFIDDLFRCKLLRYVVEGLDGDMIITYENELEAIEMINDFLQGLPYTSIDEATRLQLVRQMKEIQNYFGTDLAMSGESFSPYYSYRERFLSFSNGEEKEDAGIITPELLKRLASIRFPDDNVDLLWILANGLDCYCDASTPKEELQTAYDVTLAIREMLQKSDDEALNGKLWYFDDTISKYEKRLK